MLVIGMIPKEYILAPDEDLARAITGEELLERVIPRIEKLFDGATAHPSAP